MPRTNSGDESPLRLRALATSPSARVSLAGTLLDSGHATFAEREVRIALGQNPESAEGHLVLALIEMQQSKPDEAAARLQLAVRLDPSNKTAWLALAQVRRQAQDLDAAVSAIDEALRVCEEPKERAEILVVRGDVLSALDRQDEAERCYQQALAGDLGAGRAHRGMARRFSERGDWPAAQLHAERAIRLQSADASIRRVLGDAHDASGEVGAALWQYTLSLVSSPDGYRHAASRNVEKGYHEEAVALLRTAMLFHSRDVATALELARTYLRLGRPEAALAVGEAALRQEPDHAEARRFVDELRADGTQS